MARDPLLRANTAFGSLANFVLTGYGGGARRLPRPGGAAERCVAGVLLALTALGGMLGASLAHWAPAKARPAVLMCRAGVAPFGLLIPLADHGAGLGLFLLGNIVVTGGIVAGNVIWSGFVQSCYPAELLGRLSASVQFFNSGSIPCGAVVAGILAAHLGVRPTLWIMLSGLILSSFVLLVGPLRRFHDLPVRA